MLVVYTLLVAHFIADFICQSDWMALNKSKSLDALTVHVLVYSWVLALFVAFALALSGWQGDTRALSVWIIVNCAAHFVQDAITSQINAKLWFIDGVRPKPMFRGRALSSVVGSFDSAAANFCEVAYNDKRHWFFVGIGFDQLLHYVTLFVTAGWWLK
jgi:hypothetical protein